MYTNTCSIFHKIKHVFAIVGSLLVLGYCIFTTIQRRYSLSTISMFLYADLILVHYCKHAYQKLPPREKSPRKYLLKFALFLLFSGNLFAIVSQSAPYYDLLTAVLFYALAIGGSGFIFYAYVIYDGDDSGEIFCGGELKRGCSMVESSSNFEKV